MIDLHVHTNKSDGQYSPSETVRKAKGEGITHLAITDHDVVFGLAEGAECAKEVGITFIPGIEISVDDRYTQLHILGYCIDISDPILLAESENFILLRRQREERLFKYLEEKGVVLDKKKVYESATLGKPVNRPQFARAMVEAGYVKSIKEAFNLYLDTKEFYELKLERPKPSAEKGVQMILKAGGKPVLAHPTLLETKDKKTEAELDALIAELKGYGLAGIECHYSENTYEQTTRYLALAKKYKLDITGGSDFHGSSKPDVFMGKGTEGLQVSDIEWLWHDKT